MINTKYVLAWLCAASLILTACEEARLDPGGEERGMGKVTDFSIEKNIRIALYSKSGLKTGKKPELTYGSMDSHFITIGETTYMVEWNDIADFKALQKGQEVSFRASDYIARLEKNGKLFRVIRLNEM
jgi:hypothetical protein